MVYVIPYAGGINNDGGVDEETKRRCDYALIIAKEEIDAVIVLGSGLQELAQMRNVNSFAAAMENYLIEKGWPQEKIVSNAQGYETVGETAAALELVNGLGGGKIIAVSTWDHLPRIWLIWFFGFGRLIKLQAVWHPITLRNWLRDILAIPFSLTLAIAWNPWVARTTKHLILKHHRSILHFFLRHRQYET